MATPNLTKSQLKKLGVTYRDTTPTASGLERNTWPYLTCNKCGQIWAMPVVRGAASLPDGYWICPKGCNKPGA